MGSGPLSKHVWVCVCVCVCQYGTTPLIWASRKGHFDCVMHLLEDGADVDQEGAVWSRPGSTSKLKMKAERAAVTWRLIFRMRRQVTAGGGLLT